MKEILSEQLKEKAAKIKIFFCDIDGTLTDGSVYYSKDGEQLKKFSLRDGTGFFLLKLCGIKSGFITTENSDIVSKRAQKLKIDKYIFGTQKKLAAMNEYLKDQNLQLENVAYIGDEINDVNLLRKCGLSFAVADANDMVKGAADIVCKKKGGEGAFREAVGFLLELKNIDVNRIIEDFL